MSLLENDVTPHNIYTNVEESRIFHLVSFSSFGQSLFPFQNGEISKWIYFNNDKNNFYSYFYLIFKHFQYRSLKLHNIIQLASCRYLLSSHGILQNWFMWNFMVSCSHLWILSYKINSNCRYAQWTIHSIIELWIEGPMNGWMEYT